MSLTVTVRYFAAAREKAQKSQERLTLPDGATVKTLLDTLVKHGVADLTMTDQGVLVYRFSGFLSAAEKAEAV